MSARTSSSTESSTRSAIPEASSRKVASVCYPSGKWYDCLRPTTAPYQGFGSIANFTNVSNKEHESETGENWTRDIYGKMN